MGENINLEKLCGDDSAFIGVCCSKNLFIEERKTKTLARRKYDVKFFISTICFVICFNITWILNVNIYIYIGAVLKKTKTDQVLARVQL